MARRDEDGLTERESRFTREYPVDRNGTQAAIRAGYSAKTAKQKAHNLLQRDDIRAVIDRITAEQNQRAEIDADRLRRQLEILCTYDPTQALGEMEIEGVKGKALVVRDPRKLPDDLRQAIVELKPVQVGDRLLFSVKFVDKLRAIEMLARHLQMFKDTVVVENVFRVVRDMEDDELDRRIAELERTLGEAATPDSVAGTRPSAVH